MQLSEREAAIRELLEAARCMTVMRTNDDGSIVIGPRGWQILQDAVSKHSKGRT